MRSVATSSIARASRFVAYFLCVLLACLVGYLAISQYRARVALQGAQIRQLGQDLEKRAFAVGYFFSERIEDVNQFAKGRELSIYFENLALGMSMEYGLRSSLLGIRESFDHLCKNKLLGGQPIYSRIIFLDASGEQLAAGGDASRNPAAGDLKQYLGPNEGRIVFPDELGGEMQIAVSVPFFFKGKFSGRILAWIPLSILNDHFAGDLRVGSPTAIVYGRDHLFLTDRTRALVSQRLQSLLPELKPGVPTPVPATTVGRPDVFVIRAPVSDVPLSLLAFVPSSNRFDVNSPRNALVVSGGMAAIIIAGIFLVIFLNTKNAALGAKLEATSLLALEMRKAREAADSANRAKSDFLATMSHEIRTPMNAVIGFVNILLDTELSLQQREYMKNIRVSGDALLAIVNDILDFSKIESSRLELDREPLDLRSCLEEAVSVSAGAAAQKRIELRCDIAADVPPAILGDATRLRQVLMNLVSNAVKFTAEEGIVQVSVSRETRDENDWLRIGVRDTGIGISEDMKERLFKPFSQVDSSTTRLYGGSGLGLVICKRLVEMMGGDIGVESEPGRGSLFTVKIPVIPVATVPAEPKHSEFQRAPGLTAHDSPLPNPASSSAVRPSQVDGATPTSLHILVAEDSRMSRTVAKLTLERLGHGVETVTNGLEALEAVKRQPYDAVLMDVRMPEMDGLEATRQIREYESRQANRSRSFIIALTADALTGDREKCINSGMDDFLSKPLNPEALKTALERSRINPSQARLTEAIRP